MKFIVIDTWNGGGMDDYNGESIKIFSEVGEACKYAKNKARDEVTENRDMEPYVKEYILKEIKGTMFKSFGYEEEGGNEGTYQVHFLKDDIYAINIKCNVNKATLLNRKEYDDLLDYLHEEVEKKDGDVDEHPDGSKFIDDGQYYNKLVILNN